MDIKDCFEERFLMSSEESKKKYEEYTKQVLENLAPKFVRKNKIPKLDYLPIPEREALSTFNNEFFNFDSPIIQKEREKNKENRWIPCSERLPEECREVLVWYRRYGDYNDWYDTYGIGFWYKDIWSVIDGGTRPTVYAWMSLPLPYSPNREEGR